MGFIDDIRQKPKAVKLRVIWTVSIVVVLLLIAVWIASVKFYRNTSPDTTLFQAIGTGFKNLAQSYKKQ